MITDIQKQDQIIIARRRKRSIVLGIVLAIVAVLFYVLTLVKMGPGLFDRAL